MNDPSDVEINTFASKEIKIYYEDEEHTIPDHFVCKLKNKKIEVDVVDFGAEWHYSFVKLYYTVHDISLTFTPNLN